MQKLQGTFVVMVTPFTSGGEVDYRGMRRNIEWWIEQKVHGLIPLGSTGEFASLSDVQKKQITETVMETVNGRLPVVVGATAETTEKAIDYTAQARELGAAAALILPPYYYAPSQEEIYWHYRRISETVDLPIMVYNNPFTANVDILPQTVARLAELPRLDYIKESSGDIKRIASIRQLSEDRITVFCGWEDLAWESFAVGAKGWVCVIGNILPRAAAELYELTVQQNDLSRGWELYKRLLPILRHLEYAGKTQKVLKYALDTMGLCGGYSASPKLPLTDEDKAEVDALLEDFQGASS
jgi:4-hydroxy-tetrahydrodipicolinate synthase